MADTTTIAIPKALWERLAAAAADADLAVPDFLQSLIDSHDQSLARARDREHRLAAMAAAFRDASEEDLESYRKECAEWGL